VPWTCQVVDDGLSNWQRPIVSPQGYPYNKKRIAKYAVSGGARVVRKPAPLYTWRLVGRSDLVVLLGPHLQAVPANLPSHCAPIRHVLMRHAHPVRDFPWNDILQHGRCMRVARIAALTAAPCRRPRQPIVEVHETRPDGIHRRCITAHRARILQHNPIIKLDQARSGPSDGARH
jgi:hypothetical protein